jgi:hypothetical protein
MKASTQRTTSSATIGCTMLPLLYVSSFDGSSVEVFDTERFIVEVKCSSIWDMSCDILIWGRKDSVGQE